MGEKWIDFVKRIQSEGSKKDKDYSFKQAMVDASKRKSEWKNDSKGESSSSSHSTGKKTKKSGKKGGKKGTKKRRGGRKCKKQ